MAVLGSQFHLPLALRDPSRPSLAGGSWLPSLLPSSQGAVLCPYKDVHYQT
jgi:hypothetical protein